MGLRDSLQKLRDKKTEIREDIRGVKEDLLSARPTPLRNIVHRRTDRLRSSIEARPAISKIRTKQRESEK